MKKTLNSKLILCICLFMPFALHAQFEFQMGTGPGGLGYDKEDSTSTGKPVIDPFAEIMVNDYLGSKPTDFFQIISISSSNAAREFTRYLRRGFYKRELITLLIIAEEAKQKLEFLAKKRMEGKLLKDIAGEWHLPYDEIRKKAREIKAFLLDKLHAQEKSEEDKVPPPEDADKTDKSDAAPEDDKDKNSNSDQAPEKE
ncbi:hypothetical protein ACFL6Y_04090 [Elusimicrobiota bacterium]